MSPLKEFMLVVVGVFSMIAVFAYGPGAFRFVVNSPCDITTKPLVIECLSRGGSRCIEQVQTLNGCVFK